MVTFSPKRDLPVQPVQPVVPKRPVNQPNLVNFTGAGGMLGAGPYQGDTLEALATRQRELDQNGGDWLTGPTPSPFQGAAFVVNKLGDTLRENMIGNAEQQQREALVQLMTGVDPSKGPTQEQIATGYGISTELGNKLSDQASSIAGQEHWIPIPTPPGEDGQWYVSSISGEPKKVGGKSAGLNINTGDKMSDWVAGDAKYYNSARNAAYDLSQGNLDEALADAVDIGKDVFGAGFSATPRYKKAKTAARTWAMNVLRDESGAVLGAEEIDNQLSNYFPVFGDTKEQIEYKRVLREQRTNAFRYGIESQAPDLLAKMDADFEAYKKAADAAAAAATPPDQDPDETPPPDETIPPYPPRPAGVEDWPSEGAWKYLSPESRQYYIEQAQGAAATPAPAPGR